jgi:phenylpyruvate tautomerase PptA (4-oxalocrotonate tautomerase family)
MPIVTINLLDSWSRKEEYAISESVHDVLVDILKIPNDDFNHRILRYDRGSWQLPPGKSSKYVLIEINLFPGRQASTKARLYKELVSRLKLFAIPEDEIVIIIKEPPLDNWGIHGGVPASKSKLGYNLNV